MTKRIEELAKMLEAALGESPAATGRRLISEPELAKLCGVSRQSLRSSLDILIAGGFIVRRHGSGTYVRKVSGREACEKLPKPSFPVERIFLPDETEAGAHEPLPMQRAMVLGVTKELALYNDVNRAILKGISERIESLGHTLKLIPELTFDDLACLPPEDFASELRKANCDGYIQMANCRKRFLNGLAEAFPKRQMPPVYYVWSGTWNLTDCHPLINLDIEGATRLALSKMAANGRRRIAMLHLEHSRWSWIRKDMESFYEWTASSLGLDYKEARAIESAEKPGAVAAAMDSLWSGRQQPDGLFISDDHFLPFAARWLERKGLKPGRDIGVVTLANKDQAIDQSQNWSQALFIREQIGRLAADLLLRSIQTAGEEICSISHRPQWIQGDTH